MTIIQPNKNKSFLNRWLVMLVVPLVVGSLYLVVIYNRTVEAEHALSKSKIQLEKIDAENVELNNRLFGLFDGTAVDDFAAAYRLVQEKEPRYLEVTEQWQLASHY